MIVVEINGFHLYLGVFMWFLQADVPPPFHFYPLFLLLAWQIIVGQRSKTQPQHIYIHIHPCGVCLHTFAKPHSNVAHKYEMSDSKIKAVFLGWTSRKKPKSLKISHESCFICLCKTIKCQQLSHVNATWPWFDVSIHVFFICWKTLSTIILATMAWS